MNLQSMSFVIAYASLTISLSQFTSFSSGFTLHLHHVNYTSMASTTPTDPSPVITNSQGSFIMQFSIGNPPKLAQGYFDTASDLIYTQCLGSTTNKPIQCKTTAQCNQYLPGLTSCNPRRKTCDYETTSADGSGSSGGLSEDYIVLPGSSDGRSRSVSFNMVLGCDPKLHGPGSVGLGRGKASLVQQLEQSRFSYCLTPISSKPTTSKLNFGVHAGVGGGLWTPLITTGGISSSFYYVKLSGISVGGDQPLPYNGNMILGTGTTMSMFPEPFYLALKSAVLKHVKLVTPFVDENLPGVECFKVSNASEFPEVTVHLEGADLKLDRDNMFASMSEDEVCLAAAEASGEAIYGSLAMTNFLVGIDLRAKQVKFLKTDCTN